MSRRTLNIAAAFLVISLLILLPGCKGAADPATNTQQSGGTKDKGTTAQEAPQRTFDGSLGVMYDKANPLNPLMGKSRVNLDLAPLCYEGLFAVSPTFEAEKVLCDSFQTADYITYQFTIKSGVLFHSGEALTAKDVEYSLKAAKEAASPYKERLKNVASVKATGPNTLEIRLYAPDNRLPVLLNAPVIRSGQKASETPAGTGKYRLVKNSDSSIYAVPFEKWHGGKTPAVKRIDFVPVLRTTEVVFEFGNASLDIVNSDKLEKAEANFQGNYEISSYPTTTLHYLGVNVRGRLLKNADVRRALAAVLDRDEIIGSHFSGLGDAAYLPQHPQNPDAKSADTSAIENADLGAVKSMLQTAGVEDQNKDGVLEYSWSRKTRVDADLRLLTNGDNPYKTVLAQTIKKQLEAVGFRVEVEEQPFADYQRALSRRDFDLYLGEVALTPDLDFSVFFGGSGALNFGGYYNSALESALAASKAAVGEARSAALKQYYDAFMAEYPVIPILFERGSVVLPAKMFTSVIPKYDNIFYNIEAWKVS